MSQARIEMNAVILPSGKVLALGGSVNDEDTTRLVLMRTSTILEQNIFLCGSECVAAAVSLRGFASS